MLSEIKKYIPKKVKVRIKRYCKNLFDSARYVLKKNKTTKFSLGSVKEITFICKGNVCRSAFAEYYLKSKWGKSSKVEVRSCGLDVDQGVNSPMGALQIADEFGVDMTGNVSKNISNMDVSDTDLMIAMEFEQYQKLIQKYPQYKHNVRLLRDYLPWPERLQCNIADPYDGDEHEFRRCFMTIERALDCLLVKIEKSG